MIYAVVIRTVNNNNMLLFSYLDGGFNHKISLINKFFKKIRKRDCSSIL